MKQRAKANKCDSYWEIALAALIWLSLHREGGAAGRLSAGDDAVVMQLCAAIRSCFDVLKGGQLTGELNSRRSYLRKYCGNLERRNKFRDNVVYTESLVFVGRSILDSPVCYR